MNKFLKPIVFAALLAAGLGVYIGKVSAKPAVDWDAKYADAVAETTGSDKALSRSLVRIERELATGQPVSDSDWNQVKAAVESPDRTIRELGFTALGEARFTPRYDEALQLVAKQKEDPDPLVRCGYAFNVMRLSGPNWRDEAQTMLKDSSPVVVEVSEHALSIASGVQARIEKKPGRTP